MAALWSYNADSDEELGDDEHQKGPEGKTALLVVIDATPAMFQEWKEGEVPFRAAIKCCQALWRSKVVSSPKDEVALLFMGTEQSKNSSGFENLYVLQELSTVKVGMIEQLNQMKESEDFDGFESKIGSSEKYDLKTLFWLLKIIIDEGKAIKYQKKVMYFTCNDAPHDGKANIQKEAIKKFRDMGNVELSIVAFNEEFSVERFYSRLISDEKSIIKADSLDDLMKVVRVKQRAKRPISRTTLDLGEGIKMGIGFYSFVRPAKKPQQVRINKRTTEVLDKTTNEFRTDSGMPVLKSEERRMVEVQGEQIVFTKDELKQAKQFNERGMHLIGFLDGNCVTNLNAAGESSDESASGFNHFTWYRSPGYFIYPDEERVTGSRDLFAALLKRCHALNKIVLVKMVLTRGRPPKLACLIPTVEENSLFPQGFHVFPVPFADEMRTYDFEFKTPTSDNMVALMEKVIKKVTNKGFDVLDVYNPVVQHHWRELEKIALDLSEDDLDEYNDLTEPNEDAMVQRLGDLPQQIENGSSFLSQQSTRPVINNSSVDIAMEAKNKRLEKQTVATLKAFLDGKGVSTYGKRKADLVTAVYDYFQQGNS